MQHGRDIAEPLGNVAEQLEEPPFRSVAWTFLRIIVYLVIYDSE